MTWTEHALLITAVTTGFANLAVTMWTMLRACQTWHEVKKRKS